MEAPHAKDVGTHCRREDRHGENVGGLSQTTTREQHAGDREGRNRNSMVVTHRVLSHAHMRRPPSAIPEVEAVDGTIHVAREGSMAIRAVAMHGEGEKGCGRKGKRESTEEESG
jgi:hypothetical protein